MTRASITTPTGTSPDPATTAPLAPSVAKVLTALHHLGEATAAGTATKAGLGYSTTTPKLRTLENHGLAEPVRSDDGRTLWRLTAAGRAQAEHTGDPDPAASPSAAGTAADATDTADSTVGDCPPTGADCGTSADLDDTAATEADVPDDAAAHDHQPAQPPTRPAAKDGPTTTTADATPADADEPYNSTLDGDLDDADQATAETADPAPETEHPDDGGARQASGPARTKPVAAAVPADVPPDDLPAAEPATPAPGRRTSGSLRRAILDILAAHPGQGYKTGELCKLIDKADEGTGAKKASPGAVHIAAVKLVETGQAVQIVDRPATFALADIDTTGATC